MERWSTRSITTSLFLSSEYLFADSFCSSLSMSPSQQELTPNEIIEAKANLSTTKMILYLDLKDLLNIIARIYLRVCTYFTKKMNISKKPQDNYSSPNLIVLRIIGPFECEPVVNRRFVWP